MRVDPPSDRTIFLEAIEHVPPERWEAFLDKRCAGDEELLSRVRRLMQAHLSLGEFHERPDAGSSTRDHAAQAAPPASVGTRIGPYLLRELIGEGGMGEVYVAEQTARVRRKVAVKVLKPGVASRDVVARFEAERQALAMMDHPNIARVLDGGATVAGLPYFVMELVHGVPITDYCDQQRLDTRERLQLILQVCSAVQHAHQKGVIHRDLKPTNILVPRIDGQAVPKVIDFGIAKAASCRLSEKTVYTQISQLIGTPQYMSPEQTEMGVVDVDTRSDVYSLGVVLYELLTGETPFRREAEDAVSFEEVRRCICEQEPRRPSATVSTCGGSALDTLAERRGMDARQLKLSMRDELDWLVLKALEKDRDRRYESASALMRDVERYLTNQPISAQPPSATYRFRKFCQRHKSRIIPAAIVASVMSLGLIAALAAFVSERSQKARVWQTLEQTHFETSRRLYASQAGQASDAWQASDYGSLANLIAKMTPTSPQSPDFRGWEWRYLHRQSQLPFAATPQQPAWQAAWHPRENQIAVVVAKSERVAAVEIWQPGKRRRLREVAELHDIPANDISGLRWTADGKRMALAANNGRAVVLDAATGERLFDRQAHSGSGRHCDIRGFDLSPSGRMLATSSFFGEGKIWDLDADELRYHLPDRPMADNISSLRFSPPGDRLAAAGRFGRRFTLAVDSENLETELWFAGYQPVNNGSKGVVRWAPDGDSFAATDGDIVAVYQRDQEGAPLFTLHHPDVRSVCWHGKDRLISSGLDQSIRIWDAADGRELRALRIDQTPSTLVGVARDGQYFAAISDRRLQIVELKPPAEYLVLRPPEPRDDSDLSLSWSRDGRRIAVAHLQGSPDQWTGHEVRVQEVDTTSIIALHDIGIARFIDWGSDDECVLAIDNEGREYRLGVTDPTYRDEQLRVDDALEAGLVIAAHREAGWWAYANNYRQFDELCICDLETRAVFDRIKLYQGVRPSLYTVSLAQSPDGHYLAAACYQRDGTYVLIYDTRRRRQTAARMLRGVTQTRGAIAWEPSAAYIAIGVEAGSILLLDAKSLQTQRTLVGHQAQPKGIAWAPDGTRIASCSSSGAVFIWEAVHGDGLATIRLPGTPTLRSVAWSPSGRQLAVGAADGQVFILDAGAAQQTE